MMKVLFLGNNYNLISVACLERLLQNNNFSVAVGIHDPRGDAILKTARKVYRTSGPVFLLSKGWDLLVCTSRVRLREWGFQLKGYRSLHELMTHHTPVEFFWCDRINSLASIAHIKAIAPDLTVVVGFSRILKPPVIEIPRNGTINLHPSLLPKYRGPNPFYWLLQNNESTSGVTVHYVDAGIDSGDIILQEEFAIAPDETELTLRDKSASLGSRLLLETIGLIDQGRAPRVRQNEAEASYYSFPPRGKSRLG
jgi:methionyl-tRNA formyltransferase